MSAGKNANNRMKPILALLTEVKERDEPDFGKVQTFCEELHQGISEIGGIFYVFALTGYNDEGVNGFYYDEDEWKKSFLPLPHVIYNRISSRRTELSHLFKSFLNKLNDSGIKIFNPRFLSKWETHEILMAEDHLHPFLPETYLYSKERLESMLEDHDELYIKPVHGSQGRHIIRLQQREGLIQASFSSSPEKTVPAFGSFESLARSIAQRTAKQQVILQQGIQLSELNGRKMDFRVLCHKNAQNDWTVTSIVARVSAEQFFVSNIAHGGEVMRPLQAISKVFGKDQARQQVALMKELALEIADAVGRHSEGHTAELGIDIGIDHNGKLWLIEANSKPSKNFEERGKRIRPSAKAIIDHSLGLIDGFHIGGDGG